MKPRLIEAYQSSPWWPTPGIVAAEVEYIGSWPLGGSGMCVRRFPADSVAESNRQARTFMVALQVAGDGAVRDRGDWWEIAA